MLEGFIKAIFAGTYFYRIFSGVLLVLVIIWIIWGIIETRKAEKVEYEKENKPELLIVEGTVFEKGKLNEFYKIHVENFGKSTTPETHLNIKYNVPQSIEYTKKINDIAHGRKVNFDVEILPDWAIEAINKNWEKDRDVFIEKFKKNETVISFNVELEYRWNEKWYKSRQHTILHEYPDKVTMW